MGMESFNNSQEQVPSPGTPPDQNLEKQNIIEQYNQHNETIKNLLDQKTENLKRRMSGEITGIELDRLDGEIDGQIESSRSEMKQLLDSMKGKPDDSIEQPDKVGPAPFIIGRSQRPENYGEKDKEVKDIAAKVRTEYERVFRELRDAGDPLSEESLFESNSEFFKQANFINNPVLSSSIRELSKITGEYDPGFFQEIEKEALDEIRKEKNLNEESDQSKESNSEPDIEKAREEALRNGEFLIGDSRFNVQQNVIVKRTSGDIENDWYISRLIPTGINGALFVEVQRQKNGETLVKKVPSEEFLDWQSLSDEKIEKTENKSSNETQNANNNENNKKINENKQSFVEAEKFYRGLNIIMNHPDFEKTYDKIFLNKNNDSNAKYAYSYALRLMHPEGPRSYSDYSPQSKNQFGEFLQQLNSPDKYFEFLQTRVEEVRKRSQDPNESEYTRKALKEALETTAQGLEHNLPEILYGDGWNKFMQNHPQG